MKKKVKVRLVNLLVMVMFLALVLSLTFTYALKVTAANSNLNEIDSGLAEVVVQDGDTLWCLSQKYCPDIDTRKVVHQIKKINDLKTVDIVPGQLIKIPWQD